MSNWTPAFSNWIDVDRVTPPYRRPAPRGIALVAACTLALQFGGGCMLPKYATAKRLADVSASQPRMIPPADAYPDACRLTQRVLIRVGGRDLDMVGYLYLQPGGAWAALALGDMGMEMFRLQHDGETSTVAVKPDSIPLGPLVDGIIGDIQHLFAAGASSTRSLVRRSDGEVGLVLEYADGRLDEYTFGQDRGMPIRSVGVRGRRIVREAVYHDPKDYAGAPGPLPERIVLRNHRWHYTMEIVLLDVRIP